MKNLADEASNAGLLTPARMALMSTPSHMTHEISGLTEKNLAMWASWEGTATTGTRTTQLKWASSIL